MIAEELVSVVDFLQPEFFCSGSAGTNRDVLSPVNFVMPSEH